MKKTAILVLVFLILPITCVYASENVILGGDSIGIEGEYEGVYVSGTYPFTAEDTPINPEKNIHIKDIIIEVNQTKIKDINTFSEIVNSFQKTINEIPITILREGKRMQTTLTTSYKDGKYTYGLYLKDTILGVGTLTFYNPSTNQYAALGHPITNDDNSQLQSGDIFDANITHIEKATEDKAGEKSGQIAYDEKIGEINKNTPFGIYGEYLSTHNRTQTIQTADKEDLALGEATLYTVIDGTTIAPYTIEITNIDKNNLTKEKAITFKVIDETLLAKCGGIIHGMSGSPIVQNNKLIGAITHVSLEDPKVGYAIFIDVMLSYTKK